MAVTFRRATAADYQAILDLDPNHDIYEGEDYLPSQLEQFIHDPDRALSVCVLNGRVVSV